MSSQDVAPDKRAARRQKREDRKKAAPAEPLSALEDALMSAHRIAMSVGELSAFRDSDVSVAEWTILRAVGDGKDVPLKEIITKSGNVSRQRIRKLLSDLQTKKLLASGKTEESDKRTRTISSTPAASRVLASVSGQLQSILGKDEKGKSGRRFATTARSLDRLAKQIRRSQSADKPRRRKKGESASAADDED